MVLSLTTVVSTGEHDVVVSARSAMIASVLTDVRQGTILTTPFGFDNNLLVANVLTVVENSRTRHCQHRQCRSQNS